MRIGAPAATASTEPSDTNLPGTELPGTAALEFLLMTPWNPRGATTPVWESSGTARDPYGFRKDGRETRGPSSCMDVRAPSGVPVPTGTGGIVVWSPSE